MGTRAPILGGFVGLRGTFNLVQPSSGAVTFGWARDVLLQKKKNFFTWKNFCKWLLSNLSWSNLNLVKERKKEEPKVPKWCTFCRTPTLTVWPPGYSEVDFLVPSWRQKWRFFDYYRGSCRITMGPHAPILGGFVGLIGTYILLKFRLAAVTSGGDMKVLLQKKNFFFQNFLSNI